MREGTARGQKSGRSGGKPAELKGEAEAGAGPAMGYKYKEEMRYG